MQKTLITFDLGMLSIFILWFQLLFKNVTHSRNKAPNEFKIGGFFSPRIAFQWKLKLIEKSSSILEIKNPPFTTFIHIWRTNSYGVRIRLSEK